MGEKYENMKREKGTLRVIIFAGINFRDFAKVSIREIGFTVQLAKSHF